MTFRKKVLGQQLQFFSLYPGCRILGIWVQAEVSWPLHVMTIPGKHSGCQTCVE